MSAEEHHKHLREHFARIRITKFFLRFVPRRAVFHKYPLIGRFADLARKRSYLWSFNTPEVRPAFYIGSVLSFMPIIGVQLPAAFLIALLLRLNVMVMGGLQFVTNPVTAGAIYYGTYQLGKAVIDASGFGKSIEVVERDSFYHAQGELPLSVAEEQPTATGVPDPEPPTELKWTQRMGTAINALILGAVLGGVLFGGILDLLWRFGVSRAEIHRKKVLARRHRYGSTHPPPPAQ